MYLRPAMIGTILVPVEGTSAMIAKALLEDTPSFAVDEEGNVPRAEEYGRKKVERGKKKTVLRELSRRENPRPDLRTRHEALQQRRRHARQGNQTRGRARLDQRGMLTEGGRCAFSVCYWWEVLGHGPAEGEKARFLPPAMTKWPVLRGSWRRLELARAAECSIKGAAGQQTHVSTTRNYTGIDKCDWGQDGADPAERCRR